MTEIMVTAVADFIFGIPNAALPSAVSKAIVDESSNKKSEQTEATFDLNRRIASRYGVVV